MKQLKTCRTSQSKRASAADRQRALRVHARDPRRRSRPLRVVTACAFIVIMVSMAILPTFAASAGYKGEDTFIAGSNVQAAEIIGAVSKYDLPYQTSIVGDNPSFFGSPQKSQTIITGNSLIINSKMVFDDSLWPTYEGDAPWEITIPMYNFYPDTPLSESDVGGVCNAIHFVWSEFKSLEKENIEMYYISLDGVKHMVYYGNYWFVDGRYFQDGYWLSQGYRTIYPSGGTGETPWTQYDNGILYYNFLKGNADFTTYSGSGNPNNLNLSPFKRTWDVETSAVKQTNERVKATTKYTIKAWWQAGKKPLSIKFYGQNVVIDNRSEHLYPMMNELDDVSPFAPQITHRVRYTYFFNDSNIAEEERWVVYTGEQTIRGTWNASNDGHYGARLYPSTDQLFGTEAAKRIGGVIYDEYETTITWNPQDGNYLQNNFTLNITDYYYKGAERRANEAAGFFDAFRRNFDSVVDPKYSSLGAFISESVGGFLDKPILGNFSIGNILLTIIGIGLVITFLRMFAGG